MEIPTDEDTKPKVSRNSPPPIPEYTSGTLFAKHIFALQVKRFHHSKRNKKGVFCEVSKQNLGSGTRSQILARLSRMNIHYVRTSKLVLNIL